MKTYICKCDVCGKQEEIDEIDEQVLPDGWTAVTIDGPGPDGKEHSWEMEICHECAPGVHRASGTDEYPAEGA